MGRRNKVRLKVRDILIRNPDVFHFLCELCQMFETPYVRGGIDAQRETDVRMGQQLMGIELMNIVNMSKEELIQLHQQENFSYAQDRETFTDLGVEDDG